MRKTVVFRIALSMVLAGGFFVNAQAECCLPQISPKSSCSLNGSDCSNHRDTDRDASSNQQGAAENPNPGSFKHDKTNTGGGVSNGPQDKSEY
jgi:hypothetical protein